MESPGRVEVGEGESDVGAKWVREVTGLGCLGADHVADDGVHFVGVKPEVGWVVVASVCPLGWLHG